MKWRGPLLVVGYFLWALFVNACNQWLLVPLVLDYAALGLMGVVVMVIIWFSSVPRASKRRWIGFTLFSLLLANGVSSLVTGTGVLRFVWMAIAVIGLMVLARFFARVRWLHLLAGAVAVLLANFWLPIGEWSFLTHFAVADRVDLPIRGGDFPVLPTEVVNTPDGQEVVTLKNIQESSTDVEQEAEQATGTTGSSLEDILRNYQHRYAFVAIRETGRRFHLSPMTLKDVRSVDPFQMVNTFFPTIQAFWTTENGDVVQYMAPALTPDVLTNVAVQAGNLPANLVGMAEQTANAEAAEWAHLLQPVGGPAQSQALHIVNGWLVGQWGGRSIHIPVTGDHVVATGAFTAPGVDEALISGQNLLEIVSLQQQKVVSEYRGTPLHPLSNDIVTGPIDNSGRDVVFVNSSPAQILEPVRAGSWNVLYQAPNPSLRFEAAVRLGKDTAPEIITDDPSLVRNSPTRYFTSYTYRGGQLVRNWRVYHTNVVNVHPVQFRSGGPTDLVVGVYGTGEIYVLQRHFVPVVPLTSVALALVVLGGFAVRLTRRGGTQRG